MKSYTMRALALLCLFLLLSSALPPVAYAAEGTPTASLDSVGESLPPLEAALYRGMMAGEERIDISSFRADRDEVSAAMQHLYYSVPELFHLDQSYSLSSTGEIVAAVVPQYTLTGEALEEARARYLIALDEILAGVDPTWPEALICLYLHDYLCTAFAYDTTLAIYDAYRFLTEGQGVCQSYTLVYIALLSHFDIPTSYATGEDNGTPHIWNIVYLDGIPYHVDVTWGDPLVGGEDAPGTAHHTSFLKSDAAMDAAGHGNRENYGGVVCSDTRYDDILLNEIHTSTAISDGIAYGITDGKLYRLGASLLEESHLYTVEGSWRTGMQTLAEKPTGLAAHGGLLYTNAPHSILAIDPASGTASTVHTVDGLLLGLYGYGGTLYFAEAQDIHGTGLEIGSYPLPAAVPPCTGEHTYLEYAVIPATCGEEGTRYFRCTACGMRTSAAIPTLPHSYESTVVPPSYTAGGYTLHLCGVCGDSYTDTPTDPLPMPGTDDYRAAVARALAAEDAAAFLAAVAEARAIEPYADADAIRTDKEALDAACATYDGRVTEINSGFGDTLFSLLFADTRLLTAATEVLAVLALVFRRLYGS
ncbi:MAG: hypothetical protein J6T24_01900 [Clostridia bacterium]|nr:hypothetical protein [Clostridia bacterium]